MLYVRYYMTRPGHVALFGNDALLLTEPEELLNNGIAPKWKVHTPKAAGLELGRCLYNLCHKGVANTPWHCVSLIYSALDQQPRVFLQYFYHHVFAVWTQSPFLWVDSGSDASPLSHWRSRSIP